MGDIHGAFSALELALNRIAFDGTKDRLFSVGDLVDRGPESERVLEWTQKPWFHAVLGNHDFMARRSALGDPFDLVNHAEHGGAWLTNLPRDVQQRIGRGLAELPMAIEVETAGGLVGILHADFPSDDWVDLNEIDWSLAHRMESQAGQCLWSVARFNRCYEANVRNVRAVLHGHVTVPKIERLGNVFYIDTGGWHQSGEFTLLDLGTLVPLAGPDKEGRSSPDRRNR